MRRPTAQTLPALSRSVFLRKGSAALLGAALGAATRRTSALTASEEHPVNAGGTSPVHSPRLTMMNTRTIPSSGEQLPVIGCGTWQTFDVGESEPDRRQRAQVLETLFEAGGSVIDSSPMYGRSEQVVGELLAQAGQRSHAFVATKVWTRGREAGIAQMNQSMALLQADPIDLMQVHNLLDWQVHLETLRGWKERGRVRYLGVTHYTRSAYPQLESVLRSESLDFVQFNYSAEEREAEKLLLPLAADRGIAVLVNLPFGGGGLLRRLGGKPLPGWAPEIECTSWAQLLLKFVLSNPAVTCVIPGTSKPRHMLDNARAGTGALPDARMRERIAAAVRDA
jgi:aryl-alcohol dehydrogenase-like predicted oxidoreductase